MCVRVCVGALECVLWQGGPCTRLVSELEFIGVYSLEQIYDLSCLYLEGKRKKLKGRGETGQRTAHSSLTQQFISEFCQLNKCNFFLYIHDSLHRADVRRRSIKSALTI